jgi:quercetin dioxygenase-like cupin family protein
MKHKIIKSISLLLLATLLSCNNKNQSQLSESDSSEKAIFPKGELGPATHFTGNAYNFGLVSNDSIYNTLVGNVYFEKGARSNWHIHPSGQILIILDGEGYHQMEGKPRQTMKKGDVIKCPPKIKHWRGATCIKVIKLFELFTVTCQVIKTWPNAYVRYYSVLNRIF